MNDSLSRSVLLDAAESPDSDGNVTVSAQLLRAALARRHSSCARCHHNHKDAPWSEADPEDGTCWATAGPLICGCKEFIFTDTRAFLRSRFGDGFPPIVTLCGSTRFVDAFNEHRKRLTHEGMIVLSIEIVTTQQYNEDPQHVNRKNKEMLDELHKRKIDLSDYIFVLNVGGYIGESTRSEIDYALTAGKHVVYLEPI